MKRSLEQIASIESEILKRVRAHPGVSRIALARKLRIAPSTIGSYTSRLVAEGFLLDSERGQFEVGRPPTALRLNPEGGQFIGVDFEARNIMAMAVDFSDRPLRQAHKTIQRSDSAAAIIKKIEKAITDVLPEDHARLLAIGVGVPGLVDPVNGVAVHYKYINNWKNIPLAAPLARRFGVPVYLENCVRSMALAELWFGQGRGVTDWLCFGIRSGIGVGIVAGGQLQHGATFRAGEVGRWSCPLSSRTATHFFDSVASDRLELQDIASARAIVAALERGRKAGEKSLLSAKEGSVDFSDVVQAALQRDKLTVQIVQVAAEALGWAVAKLALALDPSLVILAGPLTSLGDILLDPLRARAEQILRAAAGSVPNIVSSSMGEYSGALGAAALAVHEWKPAR
ncbi:MAG: hypothetical protein C5B50_04610 [Verrucomicrobia bacterium]|nr:MAG: hypothetical protein C5B50_04610 [Verrucomicrobiota bacterium]